MESSIKWAVIPCAGKGTRFLPITKGVPKEMLPIVDRPTLDYIVDELVESGIENIVFVVSKDKEDIKKYYDKDLKYEEELISKGKKGYADAIHNASNKANFYYVIQEEQLGLGHAVLQAKDIVKNNDFIVCCGDDICTYKGKPPVRQMIECYDKIGHKCVVGGQTVAKENISKYGCMDVLRKLDDRSYQLKGIVEKPKIEEAPSLLASLGKWILPTSIFSYLGKGKIGSGGEIQLTDAIYDLMQDDEVYFYDFEGRRYDCGDKLGFIEAIIDISLSRDDLKEGIEKHIKELKL